MLKKLGSLITTWLLPLVGLAQDPAGFLFNQHGSTFNPALAGSSGSQSIALAYRQQWVNANDPGYHTAILAYEESLPCAILDYGINALWDQEGSGLLTTYEINPRVSVNLPIVNSKFDQINLRLGAGMSFGRQRIEFDRLVFSDQLHPKYGNIYSSTFIPPDENVGAGYFQPGIGFVLQMYFNKLKYKAMLLNVGASFHNSYVFGNNSGIGYGRSVLGLLPPQSPRFSAHADFEFIPGSSMTKWTSLKPMIFYERQQSLSYIQMGLDVGLSNVMRVGGYLHTQKLFNAGDHTNWFSVTSLFRPYFGDSRFDFYFTYSFNVSGLKHAFSPLMEIGVKKHFSTSTVCHLMGRSDDINYWPGPKCIRRIQNRKLYENIWYK